MAWDGNINDDLEPAPIWLDAGAWSEGDIPRRAWIAPGYMLRGAVSVLVGPPSAAKSLLALTWGAALALGRDHGDFRPVAKGRTLVFNVEDDAIEQQRRMSAALRQFDAVPADLADRVPRAGPNGAATLLSRDADGRPHWTEAAEALTAAIKTHEIDVLIVDPLSELHCSEENSNGELRAVIAKFRELAVACNIAVLIVHHTRKGQLTPGDVDSARGASSVIGAARIVLTLNPMSESEADSFGINPALRSHFARLDAGKSNYAPLSEARWYEKIVHTLDNDEAVPALSPWQPPAAKAASTDEIAALLAEIKRGTGGAPYSPKISKEGRSIRHLFARHGFTGTAAQRDVLDRLYAAGAESAPFRAGDRHKGQGLRCDGLPAVQWLDEGAAVVE